MELINVGEIELSSLKLKKFLIFQEGSLDKMSYISQRKFQEMEHSSSKISGGKFACLENKKRNNSKKISYVLKKKDLPHFRMTADQVVKEKNSLYLGMTAD